MLFSRKQQEYIRKANSRWNVQVGAVRSGKSFVDIAYVIPERLRAVHDKDGLNVILGVSKESVERNVLQPMREIYTSGFTAWEPKKRPRSQRFRVPASNTATGMRLPNGTVKCL